MLLLKNIRDKNNVCFRFVGPDAPDTRPTSTERDSPKSPSTWDWIDWPGTNTGYVDTNKNVPIELLEHWSTHPEPTPLKEQILTIETYDLRKNLKVGDCFMYVDDEDHAGKKACVCEDSRTKIPEDWMRSQNLTSVVDGDKGMRRVRHIPHWKSEESSRVVVLHVSECGKYGIINGKNVPGGVARSETSQTVTQAINDEKTDISSVIHGSYSGSTLGDFFCWVALKDINQSTVPETVIASCVDPLDVLRKQLSNLCNTRVDGLDGGECLYRYETAQKTETLARTPNGFVCTNADVALNEKQVRYAQEVWELTLRLRVAETKFVADEKERNRVVSDYDEDRP